LLAEQRADVGVAGIAEGDRVGQVAGEGRPVPRHAGQAAQELDPCCLQGAVVQVMAAAVAGHQQVGAQPSRWCGEGAEGGVEEAGLLEPGDDVAAAGPPRQPRRPTAGQEHLATRVAEFLGELAAGLAASQDQDLPRRKGCRVAVVLSIDHQ
jgi:hypothetical protein